jgi:small ligand-binding sensory domain FIST
VPTDEDVNGLLMFSCVGRFFTLGFDPDGEAQAVRQRLDATGIPYTLTYSGGEVCPVGAAVGLDANSGQRVNRFHNATFVVLVL